MIDGQTKPGLHFIEIGHDADCPGRYEGGRGCTCIPTVTLHADQERFIRGELANRAARRAAAREAARAMRKAREGV